MPKPAPRPLIAIVGPTAVGKSALAMDLASAFDGEIVSADSRQVYRHMDIGTAKPSLADRARVVHHLVDILDPDQSFSLALFLELAHRAIHDIRGRDKLPIVCGGTGQYLWALLEGWQVPRVPPNPQVRRDLEREALSEGPAVLHDRLARLDPESASRIDPRNVRRVIRALEVHDATATAPPEPQRTAPPPYRPLTIGLTTDRQELYRRIDSRVDDMIERGLVEEVRNLLQMGHPPASPSTSSMGYLETAMYLRGELTIEEATQRIKYVTHRFARRQHAWFRLSDPRIRWLKADASMYRQARELVEQYLREGRGCGTMASATGEAMA